MNRLELVTETLRAALNHLATEVPDWLRGMAPAEWYARYSLRVEQTGELTTIERKIVLRASAIQSLRIC